MDDSQFNLTKKDKQRFLRKTLAKLAEEKGTISAQDLLEEATPIDSPIHDMFEWDDEVAGHQYRLRQARFYISTIEVAENPGVRQYLNLVVETKEGKFRGYFPQETILNDDELKNAAMQGFLRDVQALQARYERYDEFYKVINLEELKRITSKYTSVKNK